MKILLALFLLFLPFSARAQESLDNLPVPRWASIAAPEINLRTGPGKRYPIDWVLKKKALPVEIRQEFDHWRLIAEPGGATGWIHRSMLSGTRHGMVKNDQALTANPDKNARIVALLKKNVIARIRACQPEWCQLEIESYKGWVPKDALFGVYEKEVFE